MAGAGCLLGCENNVASAANEVNAHSRASALVVSGEACASARSSSCCSAHGAKAKRSAPLKHGESRKAESAARSTNEKLSFGVTPTLAAYGSPSSMMNCPLAVNGPATLLKANPDIVDGSVSIARTNELFANSLEQVTAFKRPPRLLNRGHTYLSCCVFLI